MGRQCFVMQRFDGARYDRLFDEIFDPAIRAANLEPYRVDRDPSASVPIDTIEKEISNSSVCFAELSENNPNVWFELGYAIAKQKPLCLVCSSERDRFPFDIQHRQVIRYPLNAVPSEHKELGTKITERLSAVVSTEESLRQNVETAARTLSIAPESDGLQPHELLALTIIFQYHFYEGVSPYQTAEDMEKGGYTKAATSLAIMGLSRKKLVEFREIDDRDGIVKRLFVSEKGEEWLLTNQHKLNLKLPGVSNTPEISDEDIPF